MSSTTTSLRVAIHPPTLRANAEVHTVYAKTKEECEVLLEQMIAEVREQIKEEKRQMKLPDNCWEIRCPAKEVIPTKWG
ncbi:MAG: hypothetical protein ACLR8L_06935 [Oscillospiraceae bacterium]